MRVEAQGLPKKATFFYIYFCNHYSQKPIVDTG